MRRSGCKKQRRFKILKWLLSGTLKLLSWILILLLMIILKIKLSKASKFEQSSK